MNNLFKKALPVNIPWVNHISINRNLETSKKKRKWQEKGFGQNARMLFSF